MTVTFDPWQLEDSNHSEPQWSESLTARARKRKVSEQGQGWRVSAISGELYDSYYVVLDQETHRYECECYHTNHGDSRRRKMCSHVLAVVLWRRDFVKTEKVERGDAIDNGDNACVIGNTALLTVVDGGGPPSGTQPSQAVTVHVNNNNDIPDPNAEMWGTPLPNWVTEIRPHQWNAVREIMQAYENGARVVWLDAPTGSGKTLIAEMVRRLLGVKGLYVCSGKTLQHQFMRDFPDAKLLMGRGNYPTELMPEPYTAGDCTMPDCGWCETANSCPYQVAKRAAIRGPLSVLNTSYFLAEGNYVGDVVNKAEFVVLDECDVLERELMGFVEFRVGPRMMKDLGLVAPKKGSHKGTIQEWMEQDLVEGITRASREVPKHLDQLEKLRYRKRLGELRQKASMVAGQIHKDEWIRDNDAGPLVMKPVKVSEYGEDYLWRHGKRWLCMSATIISPDELCDSLGLNPSECQVVRVPMTFDVEKRIVNVAPVANVVSKEKDTAYPQLASAIRRIMDMHPTERVLVHTVSYELSKDLFNRLRDTGRAITYTQSQDRDTALRQLRDSDNGVLLASSLDRGVDLKDDECRVVVVAKCPFPYLGDKQVSARMHLTNGQSWYNVQTIRSMVQMTGRAVRSNDDWCVSYILDKQFVSNLYRRNKMLFPSWWRDSLNMSFNTRSLI